MKIFAKQNPIRFTVIAESISYVLGNLDFFSKTLIFPFLIILLNAIATPLFKFEISPLVLFPVFVLTIALNFILHTSFTISAYRFYFFGRRRLFNPKRFLGKNFLYLKKHFFLSFISILLTIPAFLNPVLVYSVYQEITKPSYMQELKLLTNELAEKNDLSLKYIAPKDRYEKIQEYTIQRQNLIDELKNKRKAQENLMLVGFSISFLLCFLIFYNFIGLSFVIPAAARMNNLSFKSAYLKSRYNKLNVFCVFMTMPVIGSAILFILNLLPEYGLISTIINAINIFVITSFFNIAIIIMSAKLYQNIYSAPNS